MIKLTLYSDSDVIVNADLIESVERTPDTIITLTTGKKVMVRESVEDVVNKAITYRRLTTRSHRLFGVRGRNRQNAAMRGSQLWT